MATTTNSIATSQRIPSLDGWRGIAILMVLFDHLVRGLELRGIPFRWVLVGQHGVTIFFVLSGYLITTKLLEGGPIDLKRFYMRRFFRLAPCAWSYMLALLLLGIVLHHKLIGIDAYACLLFFRNYLPTNDATAMTEHFWSLSIEEQFYLAWPLVLWLGGRKKSLWAAIIAMLVIAAIRLSAWSYYEGSMHYQHTEVRADALMVGCVAALVLQMAISFRQWLTKYGTVVFLASLPPFLFYIACFPGLIPLSESILIAVMIASTSLATRSLPSRILEYKHLSFLGTISYSLYVWQQVFLIPHWGLSRGVVIAALLPLVAVGSYALIERPCIRLGRRIEALLETHPAKACAMSVEPAATPYSR